MLREQIAVSKELEQVSSKEKSTAKIQTVKRQRSKIPIADTTLPPQAVQLQGEIATLNQELLEMKAKAH